MLVGDSCCGWVDYFVMLYCDCYFCSYWYLWVIEYVDFICLVGIMECYVVKLWDVFVFGYFEFDYCDVECGVWVSGV